MISTRTITPMLLLVLSAAPVAAQGQRTPGMRPGAGMGNPIAPLIGMRRQLDLTSRQLVQLDSIERALLQKNRVVLDSLRDRRDTTRLRGVRGRNLTDEQRAALQARGDSLRALRQIIVRNDSTARAAAMRVLSDSQRTQVQILQAERRGFERGTRTREGTRGIRGWDRPGFDRGRIPGIRGRRPPR